MLKLLLNKGSLFGKWPLEALVGLSLSLRAAANPNIHEVYVMYVIGTFMGFQNNLFLRVYS